MIPINEKLRLYNELLKFSIRMNHIYSAGTGTKDKEKVAEFRAYIKVLNEKIESILQEICKD